MERKKKVLLATLVACVAVLGGVMVLAIVLNAREADEMARDGKRSAAIVKEKYTTKERGPLKGVEDVDHCFRVAVSLPGGDTTTSVSCNRGIDQIYDKTEVGDEIRIVYRVDESGSSIDDWMLEEWADGKLTSFGKSQ